MATIIDAKANRRKINNSGFSFGRKLVLEKPVMLEIFREADCSLRLKKYHRVANGSNNSNQKKPGLANDIFSNIYTSVLTSTVAKILSIISWA